MISWPTDPESERSKLPKYFRSLALISQATDSTSTWLCLWNDHGKHFDFVTAEVDSDSDKSFRESLHREVLETFSLNQRDILVANMAQLNLEFADTLPGHLEPMHIGISFYPVHLYSQAARKSVDEMTRVRWLSGPELLNGQTSDGWGVSPTLRYFLRRSAVIQAWE